MAVVLVPIAVETIQAMSLLHAVICTKKELQSGVYLRLFSFSNAFSFHSQTLVKCRKGLDCMGINIKRRGMLRFRRGMGRPKEEINFDFGSIKKAIYGLIALQPEQWRFGCDFAILCSASNFLFDIKPRHGMWHYAVDVFGVALSSMSGSCACLRIKEPCVYVCVHRRARQVQLGKRQLSPRLTYETG